MSEQIAKARIFAALHVPGTPLVLFNVWDPGSAKAVGQAGAKALATGSWSVAAAHGFGDGEKIPLDLAIRNFQRIVQSTALPVSVDIESGYGKMPEEVARTVARTLEAGAVGCNLEDSIPADGTLREQSEQVQRIRAARQAADAAGIPYFINARTDVFFQGPAKQHDAAMLEAALRRARAYAEAGASGLFAPGLVDKELITRLAAASPLPVNVMVSKGTPSLTELGEAGVARVSHGPGPYMAAMRAVTEAAQAAFG
ncbi:MAG TPA: isocitrate lyase/phosphoenolpyruvate mutase family protein [Gammaproteobacteria bacterium]|jgi:methylisocitrate lyase